MFPDNTIVVNIDGKDYYSEKGVFVRATGCANDFELFTSVEKDWGSLTGFILDVAEVWMTQMKRTSCQITYNHGNGSIAAGKYGMFPHTVNPYENEEKT